MDKDLKKVDFYYYFFSHEGAKGAGRNPVQYGKGFGELMRGNHKRMFAVAKNFEPSVGNISDPVENAKPQFIVSNSVGGKPRKRKVYKRTKGKGKKRKISKKISDKDQKYIF